MAFKKELNRKDIIHDVNHSLLHQIEYCPLDNLLDLLVDKKEEECFRIIKTSVQFYSKFKFFYQVLVNEIDPMQKDYLLFRYAVFNGSIEVLHFLLQNGFNVTECLDFALKSAVNVECRNLEISLSLIKTLLELGVDVTKNDNYAICACAKYFDLEIFKLLESYGADISARSNCPIKLASHKGDSNIVYYLVESGVDFKQDNNYVLRKCSTRRNINLLTLLLKSGADIRSLSTDEILKIINYSDIETIKLFIQYGLDFSNIKQSDVVVGNTEYKNKINEKFDLLTAHNIDPLVFTFAFL